MYILNENKLFYVLYYTGYAQMYMEHIIEFRTLACNYNLII